MRGRMLVGTASIEVPDSDIGFIMATPSGYAIDHGTEFSVSVDPSRNRSRFEVIEGEISMHVASTGERETGAPIVGGHYHDPVLDATDRSSVGHPPFKERDST